MSHGAEKKRLPDLRLPVVYPGENAFASPGLDEAPYVAGLEQFLPRERLQSLFDLLWQSGYEVIAPTIDEGAIVYGPVRSVEELPRGWTDSQEPGHYRLARREDDYCFGYVVGPHSWKRYLFPPETTLSTATRTTAGWQFAAPADQPRRFAFVGVRACEIAAMQIQDRVFLGGSLRDPTYASRRESAFVVAAQCTQAAATCFCVSMQTGPRAATGFDLAMTEIADGFVIVAGSSRGAELLERLPLLPASDMQLHAAAAGQQHARQQIARRVDTDGLRERLFANLEHPRWDDVARRCLSCANCTMVCPTCFCSSVSEVAELSGERVERRRQWDSCFNVDFSYMNGGAVRDDVRARYRQWLTHKLAGWIDQFGVSGCVGCGRCITWCPVGIDLTEEVAALSEPRAT